MHFWEIIVFLLAVLIVTLGGRELWWCWKVWRVESSVRKEQKKGDRKDGKKR